MFRISILLKGHSEVACKSTVDLCYIQIQCNKTVAIQLWHCSIILGCRTGIWQFYPLKTFCRTFFNSFLFCMINSIASNVPSKLAHCASCAHEIATISVTAGKNDDVSNFLKGLYNRQFFSNKTNELIYSQHTHGEGKM